MDPLFGLFTLAILLMMIGFAMSIHGLLKRVELIERRAAEQTQHTRATDATH